MAGCLFHQLEGLLREKILYITHENTLNSTLSVYHIFQPMEGVETLYPLICSWLAIRKQVKKVHFRIRTDECAGQE
ncbi:hypothetical protein BIW19_01905 [Pseudomonas putida]|nr:hypothetical protein BIW19_01905 [Pseudomonas putida]